MAGYKDVGPHNPIREYDVDGVDLASVAANTTAEEDITVTGVSTDDVLLSVQKPSLEAGLGIAGARIKAADTIAVTLINATGSPIDAASEDGWKFVVAKG